MTCFEEEAVANILVRMRIIDLFEGEAVANILVRMRIIDLFEGETVENILVRMRIIDLFGGISDRYFTAHAHYLVVCRSRACVCN